MNSREVQRFGTKAISHTATLAHVFVSPVMLVLDTIHVTPEALPSPLQAQAEAKGRTASGSGVSCCTPTLGALTTHLYFTSLPEDLPPPRF